MKLLRADPCCHSIIKEFAHTFSCAYIELWIHMGSLESTQKALLLRIFRALQTLRVYLYAKHEQILKLIIYMEKLLSSD